jgi:hypothetical protein
MMCRGLGKHHATVETGGPSALLASAARCWRQKDDRQGRLRNLGTSISAEDRRTRRTEKREVFERFLTVASTAQMAAARYRSHYDQGNPQRDMAEEQSVVARPRLIVSSSWWHPGSH